MEDGSADSMKDSASDLSGSDFDDDEETSGKFIVLLLVIHRPASDSWGLKMVFLSFLQSWMRRSAIDSKLST